MSPTNAAKRPTSTQASRSKSKGSATDPGPLIDVDWLADHLDDADLRLVHVAPDRRVYNKRHVPGATYSDLHKEIALKGKAPETGDAEREWLIPSAEQTAAVLRRWRVGDGDRIVFYDDVGLNRQAIRGYWLLRLYRYPKERMHILDGGINAWTRAISPAMKPITMIQMMFDTITSYD
jgi:thiosulfate/3-mercaptopyruvate sulfurtransferase